MATPSTTSSMTVSADHLLACRASYLRSVVPAFPAARAFAPHFSDSYVLMRSLSAESSEQVPVGFGLLSLGVKAHEVLPSSFSRALRCRTDLLKRLGLGFRTMGSGAVEVFNPETLLPQLKSITNGHMLSDNSIKARLEMFEIHFNKVSDSYPYELLGWPSLVVRNDTFTIYATSTYSGEVRFPSKQGEFTETWLRVSAAVAVVQQIMGQLDGNTARTQTRIGDATAIMEQTMMSVLAPLCNVPA